MKQLSSILLLSLLGAGVCMAHPGHHDELEDQHIEGPQRIPSVHIRVDGDGVNPWTNLVFNNDANNFQFAIVTDRTCCHRPGVFLDAVKKLNLLQPEFVMSVGDLIEGYTENTEELSAEWVEFDTFVKALEMPFFYLAGNHDYTNPVEAKVWEERYGRSYYDFTYNDVLFVVLNSNDAGAPHKMTQEQVDWFAQVLKDNPDPRWTMIFVHAPLWDMPNQNLWPEIDKVLDEDGRKFTVFAGHQHNYVKHQRQDHNYYTLATTGGGSSLRGERFGEFDHVMWVTMTDDGPVLANLMLDGIWPDDIATDEIDSFQKHSIEQSFGIKPVLFRGDSFDKGETTLRLTNDSDIPYDVELKLRQVAPVIIDTDLPSRVTVAPNEVMNLPIRFHAAKPVSESTTVSELSWKVTSHIQDQDVDFDGVTPLKVVREWPLPDVSGITVDGDLRDWKTLPYIVADETYRLKSYDKWSGKEDASFEAGLGHEGDMLYVAVKAADPERRADPSERLWMQDNVQVRIDPRPSAVRLGNTKGDVLHLTFVRREDGSIEIPGQDKLPESVKIATSVSENGYSVELAIPDSVLSQLAGGDWNSMSVNFGIVDKDTGEPGPTVLTWPAAPEGENMDPVGACFYR